MQFFKVSQNILERREFPMKYFVEGNDYCDEGKVEERPDTEEDGDEDDNEDDEEVDEAGDDNEDEDEGWSRSRRLTQRRGGEQ